MVVRLWGFWLMIFDKKIDERFAIMDGRLVLLQWMLGVNLAMTIAILWKVFST